MINELAKFFLLIRENTDILCLVIDTLAVDDKSFAETGKLKFGVLNDDTGAIVRAKVLKEAFCLVSKRHYRV